MKTIIAAAALVFVPTLAHADRLAPKRSNVEQAAMQKAAKLEHVPARAALAPKVEAPPPVRGLESTDVIAKVNTAYLPGLQRCYRKSLAVDPTVSGRLDLSFKVAVDGRVTSALQGDGIERCLTTLMQSWHFGVALDDGGLPTEAQFKISLVLQ